MDIKNKIENLIKEVLKNLPAGRQVLDIDQVNFAVEHPADLKMGDYSSNVAMVCAKKLKMNPKELAEKIVAEMSKMPFDNVEKIEVAGAGFINFYLSQEFFTESVKEILEKKENWGKNDLLAGKKVMVEYTQPNPFKPFHIGHLMSNTIGESVSRIVEFSGAKIIRANYQGDVGPHVAKAIYGLLKSGALDKNKSASESAGYIGECYAKGSDFYDNDSEAKKEIDIINKKVYDRSDEEINKIYDWGRKVTLEAFEEIYKTLGTKFDYYFFESEMAPIGEKVVRANLGNVFEESDGAIVFKAEKHDPKLHTRVFINSQGLPTYETKELGLTETKFKKENPDISVVITAHEQAEYMKVVTKAIEIMQPEIASRMKHVVHGMMRLESGKMSSRKGNTITGESLLRDSIGMIQEKIKDRDFSSEEKEKVASEVGVSALKYSILKQSIGGDIVYDFEKSISFEGDSGPYVQYSYARAKSILEKAKVADIVSSGKLPKNWETAEIEKILYRFPEIVLRSVQEFEPHYIVHYLIDLARAYNGFYGNTKIIDKDDLSSSYKVALTEDFSIVIKNGLYLLGIQAPEKM